jgi:hypothetical protein
VVTPVWKTLWVCTKRLLSQLGRLNRLISKQADEFPNVLDKMSPNPKGSNTWEYIYG